MATRQVVISDISGTLVPDGDEVKVVVTKFPNLDTPVSLDAAEVELKGLGDDDELYVVLEVHRADEVEERVVTYQQFTSLFKSGTDVATVIANAAPVKTARASSANGAAKRSKEELDEIRAWAKQNGHKVADKGRIAQEVVDAYSIANPKDA